MPSSALRSIAVAIGVLVVAVASGPAGAAASDAYTVNPLVSDGGATAPLTEPQVGLNAKAPTCWAFAEPSDGLEPSTPSLPWRCSTN